jgi:hypothetical protein
MSWGKDRRFKSQGTNQSCRPMVNVLRQRPKVYVSILALFCVWTKSLMCNDAVNRDSTFRVMSENYACKSEEFQVPCQPSKWCVIPSRRLSVYCSIRPDDLSFHSEIRQTSIFCLEDVFFFSSRHLHRIESFCASLLRPDVSAARPDSYQFSNGSLILSKFKKGKINQPSRRCGIPSGRVSL